MSTLADRVKDHTASTGTGAITLADSAPTGFRTFSAAFGAASTVVNYCIDDLAGRWEVGSGTFNGTTGLTRTTVLSSSNGNALVTFVAGSKTVFCTAPSTLLDTAADYRAVNFVAGVDYLAPGGSASGLSGLPTLASLGAQPVGSYQAAGTYASGTGSASGTNTGDQTLPTTLPASDVYAWAKASTKPSYTAADVGLGNVTNVSTSLGTLSYSYTGTLSVDPFIVLDRPLSIQLGGTGGTLSDVTTAKWARSIVIPPQSFLTGITFSDLEGVAGPLAVNSILKLTSLAYPALTTVLGDFAVSGLYLLTTLSTPSVKTISGHFSPSSLNVLTTLDLPSLEIIGGNLSFSSCNALTTLNVPALTKVLGSVSPSSNGALTTMNFISLTTVGVNIAPSSMGALQTLSFPVLTIVLNSFSPSSLPALQTLGLPALATCEKDFSPSSLAVLQTLSLPALTYVGGSFNPGYMAGLTSLTAPVLTTVVGGMQLSTFPVTTLSFPELTSIGGAFYPVSCAALTTVTLPAIQVIGATTTSGSLINFYLTPLLTTFTLGASLLRVGLGGGNVVITSCALNQASVDGILVRLAALDGTNGTTTFNSRTVTITGTSTTPSSTGLAAKATLVARGCTVTHN